MWWPNPFDGIRTELSQILVSKYLYLEPAGSTGSLRSLPNSLNFDARNRHVKYCELYDIFLKQAWSVVVFASQFEGGIQFKMKVLIFLSMMTLHATGENHMLSIVAQARRGMPAHIPCPSGHQNFCQVVDSLFRPPIRSKWSPSQTNNICSLFGVSQAVVWISAPKMSGKNTHKLNKEQGSYCPTGQRKTTFEISGKGCPTNPRSSSSESENKSSAVKSEKLASTTSSQRPQDHESFKKHGMIRTSWKSSLMYQDTLNAS